MLMSRQWKPGDVAVLALHDGPKVATRGIRGWWFGDGARIVEVLDTAPVDARPLVVIDPETRGAAIEIAQAVGSVVARPGEDIRHIIDAVQAALRSLVVDPKPPEPQGLGAVVEDGNGRRYVRLLPEYGTSDPSRVWSDEHSQELCYDDIAAVRVLSAGWSE